MDHVEFEKDHKEMLESFKAKSVGRGVWYVQHKLCSRVIKDEMKDHPSIFLIQTMYTLFLMYCYAIFCLYCREHAAEFIKQNPFLDEIDNEDDLPIRYFNWLWRFHSRANQNARMAGSATLESPPEIEVYNYFVNGKSDKSDKSDKLIKDENYRYELIQVGFWHYFYLVSISCHNWGHIAGLFYMLNQFMVELPEKQREIFRDFSEKHKFADALYDHEIEIHDLCIALFEWIYALQTQINASIGIKIYSLKLTKEVYFNLEYCDSSCEN